MTWHRVYIDDPQDSFVRSGAFTDAMFALGLARHGSGAAIYVFHDHRTGGDHYYFAPGAQAVALTFGAQTCNKPAQQALGVFLVGDPQLLLSLYP